MVDYKNYERSEYIEIPVVVVWFVMGLISSGQISSVILGFDFSQVVTVPLIGSQQLSTVLAVALTILAALSDLSQPFTLRVYRYLTGWEKLAILSTLLYILSFIIPEIGTMIRQIVGQIGFLGLGTVGAAGLFVISRNSIGDIDERVATTIADDATGSGGENSNKSALETLKSYFSSDD